MDAVGQSQRSALLDGATGWPCVQRATVCIFQRDTPMRNADNIMCSPRLEAGSSSKQARKAIHGPQTRLSVVQRHLQRASRQRAHHYQRRQEAPAAAPPEQVFTLILSNEQYATSTTATATRRSSSASSTETPSRRPPSTIRDDGDGADLSSVPEQVRPETALSTSTALSPDDISKSSAVTASRSPSRSIEAKQSSTTSKTSKPQRTPLSRSSTRTMRREKPSSTSKSSSSSKSRVTSSTRTTALRTVTVCATKQISSAEEDGGRFTRTRSSNSVSQSKKPQQRNNDGKGAARTVYDFDCSRHISATSSSSSAPSSISAIPTASVEPVPGIPSLPKADDAGQTAAFFATPVGKGTIAGISLGSAALSILLVCIVLWRRKQSRNSAAISIGGRQPGFFGFGKGRKSRSSAASSTSSFGTSSDNLIGVAYNAHVPPDDRRLAVERQEMTESLAGAGAERGFVVESRSRSAPISSNGHDSDGFGPHSSNGHDPFADPPLSGHGHSSKEGHLVTGAAAAGVSRRHKRRRSGYTADTYRRKSRPVSPGMGE